MDNMIFKRTSVRSYTDQPVTKEQIELLLRAGMAAPSACNAQPWEFIVVQNRETLIKITEIQPYSQMLKEAPLAIVVCADKTRTPAMLPDLQAWPMDCSAATQNIMLEATELGLGSVWLATYPIEEISKPIGELLNLPQTIAPFAMIAIGYPAGEVHPKDKFNPERIHWEKWSGK